MNYGHHDAQVRTPRGGDRFRCPGDRALSQWLEPEMLGLADVVGPGGVCIDVGAAAGLYTVPLSRLVGPSGAVHSVEPLPFAWPLWNRVLGARDNANVKHHCLALGSEPGKATMSVPMGKYGLVTGRSFVSQKSMALAPTPSSRSTSTSR